MKLTLDELLVRRRYKSRGRFIFLKLINGAGAPFIDRARGMTNLGEQWSGYAIQINPFRFKDGKRLEGECFVIGLIHK